MMNTMAVMLTVMALGTVPTTTPRTEQVGDGITKLFFFNFKTTSTSHVHVFVNGAEQVSGFTKTLNANQDSAPGGSVTFTVAPASAAIVRIERTLPVEQTSVWGVTTFKPAAVGTQLDNLVMIAQQQDRDKASAQGLKDEIAARIAGDNYALATAKGYADDTVSGAYAGTGAVPAQWAFTGNGASTRFAIAGAAHAAAGMYVVALSGVLQSPGTDYTIDLSTSEIVFTVAPANGVPGTVRSFGYARTVNVASTTDASSLLVTAAGSATPRAEGDRWSDVFNVKNFGAKGDGTTDDTAAIQATLDAASAAGGGKVFIPWGTFIVTPVLDTVWLKVRDNVTVEGTGAGSVIKVRNNTGNYARIFGNTRDGSVPKHVKFRNFMIDQNAAGNTTASVAVGDATKPQFAIQFNAFSDLSVTGMTFDPATGVNTVVATGYTPSDGGLNVSGNRFRFVRAASPSAYDNSAIYVDSIHYVVSGNTFENGSALGEARTAIEVHSGPGTVTGNVVRDYSTGTHVVSAYPGAANAPVRQNVTVSGNTYAHVNRGADVWALTGATASGISITGNTIYVANADYGSVSHAGIAFVNDVVATGPIEDVVVANNVITLQAEVRAGVADADSAGLLFNTRSPVTNLSVTGNIVRRAPGTGMRLASLHASGVKGVLVANNRFIDCGSNTSSTTRIGLILSGLVVNGAIYSNIIEDTGSPSLIGQYGWYLATTGASSVRFDRATNVVQQSATSDLATVMTGTGLSNTTTITASIYGTQTPRADLARRFILNGDSGSALTINKPSNAIPGQRWTMTVRNVRGAGAALGALSWGANIKAAAWVQPADGFNRSIELEWDGTDWIEMFRTPADVPN